MREKCMRGSGGGVCGRPSDVVPGRGTAGEGGPTYVGLWLDTIAITRLAGWLPDPAAIRETPTWVVGGRGGSADDLLVRKGECAAA